MNRPEPTIVRDLVDDLDLGAVRAAIDGFVTDLDLADAADRARNLVDDGSDALSRESGRVVEVVTGTVVPGTVSVVRRHPRPVIGALLAVLAVAAAWTWWSRRRRDDGDTAVTELERAV
jgi:hypothetical protein